MQQWYDNKYSMFIHFGVYSALGGVWEGAPVTVGYSEQIQAHGGIMSDRYEEFARTFNPERWDADSMARLAIAAGMRSIVITAKHHDGFCIYHSAYTPFNIVDFTPFGRDLLKELADACVRHGLNLGLYYSLIDWRLHPWTSHNANPIAPAHHGFNMNQLTELLTNYGPISELWFDMGSLTPGQSRELYELVRRLQPNCMVSGRLGNNQYDFCVMGDNQYPDFRIDAPWQTPASVFDATWGYRSWQQRDDVAGKTREKLISLISVVSRGGNYLLNIGPRGDGTVVDYEAQVLTGIGRWLQRNGEAIYGTVANPFPGYYPWGEITARGNTVYLLLSGEATGIIELPLLSGRALSAKVLDAPSHEIKIRNRRQAVTVEVPETLYADGEIRVIAVEFAAGFEPQPRRVTDARQEPLGFLNAVSHYSYACIDYYNNHRSVVKQSWQFTARRGQSAPAIFYTAGEMGKEIELSWDGAVEVVRLDAEGRAIAIENKGMAEWKGRYAFGPVRGSFDRVHVSADYPVDIAEGWAGRSWEMVAGWQEGAEEILPGRPREAYYVLQEIETVCAHDVIVALYSGDGIQVWLNGEVLAMHNNEPGSRMNRDLVLLPLKEGRNQLLVKFYNRYGYELSYGIDLRPEQVVYSRQLSPRQFSSRGIHSLEMRLHRPGTPHDAIRLNNVRIRP